MPTFVRLTDYKNSEEKHRDFLAMITMQSRMFLSSYEKLRIKLLKNHKIDILVHLRSRAFEEIGEKVVQTVAFVIQKGKSMMSLQMRDFCVIIASTYPPHSKWVLRGGFYE